jgi:hypothetical protein
MAYTGLHYGKRYGAAECGIMADVVLAGSALGNNDTLTFTESRIAFLGYVFYTFAL